MRGTRRGDTCEPGSPGPGLTPSPGRDWPRSHQRFGLLISRPVRQYISVVFGHQVRVTLLPITAQASHSPNPPDTCLLPRFRGAVPAVPARGDGACFSQLCFAQDKGLQESPQGNCPLLGGRMTLGRKGDCVARTQRKDGFCARLTALLGAPSSFTASVWTDPVCPTRGSPSSGGPLPTAWGGPEHPFPGLAALPGGLGTGLAS